MSLLSTWNATCCTLPAVQSSYTPEGSDVTLNGLQTYAVGPADSKVVIICVFDIFGLYPQTKQGADIISKALCARVLVPDFFNGNPIPFSYLPFDTPEKQKYRDEFFSGRGSFAARTKDLINLASYIKDQGATKVGVYGLCWGGKVAIQAGGEGTPIDAVASVHPAMLVLDDVKATKVPVALYPSHDEPQEVAAQAGAWIAQQNPLAAQSDYKLYPDNHHGWAGARADLSNENNKAAFADVYARLAAFFSSNLKVTPKI